MYEKPQYITPDGLRRMKKNPVPSKKTSTQNKIYKFDKNSLTVSKKQNVKNTISPEAAKVIANAIKGMMNQK